jgi:hypothetical protein
LQSALRPTSRASLEQGSYNPLPCQPAQQKEARDSDFTFSNEQKLMKMFSDNAKTYIQLSGAALALTLTFAHDILHIPADQSVVDFWMILMCVVF